MCDIDNPLYGPTGAAYVFGPQKGADPATVEFLDGQLRAFDAMIRRELGRAWQRCPAPARPAASAPGCWPSWAELQPGIEAVLDMVGFDRQLRDCDLVITGEGQLDSQSIRGKVISGVGRRANRRGVPVVVIAGSVRRRMETITRPGFAVSRRCSPSTAGPWTTASPGPSAAENYRCTLENLLRLMKSTHG